MLPESVLFASVTRVERFAAGDTLSDAPASREVIDIPADLTVFDKEEGGSRIDRFLEHAKLLGADIGYIAQNRKAWWSVRVPVNASTDSGNLHGPPRPGFRPKPGCRKAHQHRPRPLSA